MASTRMAFGSIMSTISGVADSAVAIVNVGNTLVAKAQLAADDSLKAQTVRSKIGNAVLQENAIREAAMEQALSTMNIKQFQAQSAVHDNAFAEAHASFSALFDKKD